MKKLSFNLFLLFVLSWPCVSLAAKKYRYIKREHGVQFQGSFPALITNQIAWGGDARGAYSYNWKGWVEFGPYFGLQASFLPMPPAVTGWKAGLTAEYNIIKNRGRRKLIPSIGISFGGENATSAASDDVNFSQSGLSLAMGGHGALKIFVGKRTPFTIKVAYVFLTPMSAPFQPGSLSHRIEPTMGFSYYFDFY